MVSTITLTTELTTDWCQQFRVRFSAYTFTTPRYRPPILDEMMPDINRLINSVATRYSDKTTAALHFDELVGEARLKLAELLDRGILTRMRTRGDFFKFFKASINNMARSRVQRYRFTEKRTGVKPPPRHQRQFNAYAPAVPVDDHEEEVIQEPTKNVELSLDDPDSNIQVASSDDGCSRTYDEIKEEFESLFNPAEKLVFQQMISPGVVAVNLATLDARRGWNGGKINVRIRHEHLAESVGMSPEMFQFYVLSIRRKIMAYKQMTDEDQEKKVRFNAALSQLQQVFGLQIPPEMDEMIVRRLVTMAARDQVDRVNTQVEDLLLAVGAKVPLKTGDKLSCYGVLFARNNPRCNRCSLRQGCMTDSVNIGMENITPSPRLLGSRQIRMPVVLPGMMLPESEMVAPEMEPSTVPLSSATALDYVREHYLQRTHSGNIFYTFKDGDIPKKWQRNTVLLCVDEHLHKIRICGPSTNLKKRLLKRVKGWYVPDSMDAQEVVSIIDEHAKEVMAKINAND